VKYTLSKFWTLTQLSEELAERSSDF